MVVYNRETYLKEAIDSVLGSSYQNWELIICDDNSTDNSVKIVQKYAQKDQRISVHVNETNLGQFANRDFAAVHARGKYLKYLDSDDILYRHGLEIMVNAMEQYPEAAFAMPGIPNENRPFPLVCSGKSGFARHFHQGGEFIHGPSAIIFRRSCFEMVGGFREFYYVGSDTDILIRMAKSFDYLKIQPALIWWREHEAQEFKKGIGNHEYFIFQFKRSYLHITSDDAPLDTEEKKLAKTKLRNLYAPKLLKALLRLQFSLLRDFFKENKNCLRLFIFHR